MRARHNLSLILSGVYLVVVLIVPAWHVMELAGGLHDGGCLWFASSGALLQSPCTAGGPCTNPHHHHSTGQQHDIAPCPRCSGLLGTALGEDCGAVTTAVEAEEPVHLGALLFVFFTSADVKAPRAPPVTA